MIYVLFFDILFVRKTEELVCDKIIDWKMNLFGVFSRVVGIWIVIFIDLF
jgi:hypothetical protein